MNLVIIQPLVEAHVRQRGASAAVGQMKMQVFELSAFSIPVKTSVSLKKCAKNFK